jgi:NAD(P)-dependent dehydrogenase (short-subunit alcohol dehydrogenase family)
MQLDGKLVAITGSGRGIGRAMALAFAQKRANLALIRSIKSSPTSAASM